ncbi:MAG: hypothetical protein M3393_03945 [Actinomycetota bacterium]|nr:hypothetical protein [Actinomycetota bacterium]
MRTEPADPSARRAWRQARREVAREHHPDHGGDPAVYLRKMDEVDQGFLVDANSATVPTLASSTRLRTRASRSLRRSRRRLGRGTRILRGALPRRVPGARRYVEL